MCAVSIVWSGFHLPHTIWLFAHSFGNPTSFILRVVWCRAFSGLYLPLFCALLIFVDLSLSSISVSGCWSLCWRVAIARACRSWLNRDEKTATSGTEMRSASGQLVNLLGTVYTLHTAPKPWQDVSDYQWVKKQQVCESEFEIVSTFSWDVAHLAACRHSRPEHIFNPSSTRVARRSFMKRATPSQWCPASRTSLLTDTSRQSTHK